MFGKRIANLRNEAGLTQTSFAEKVGISRSALSLYELEKREPDVETLVAIASFFNVSTDYLTGKTDEKLPPEIGAFYLTPVKNRLGRILMDFRKKNDYSEIDMSDKLGIDINTYYGIENGSFIPTMPLLQKLNSITGYGLQYLVGSTDNTQVPSDNSIELSGKNYPMLIFESNAHFRTRLEELCRMNDIDYNDPYPQLGISKQTLFEIKHNRMPILSEIIFLSYAFNVSVDYLIGKTDVPLTDLNQDELQLLLNYRDCLDSYKKNLRDRASELSMNSIRNDAHPPDPDEVIGTTGN